MRDISLQVNGIRSDTGCTQTTLSAANIPATPGRG